MSTSSSDHHAAEPSPRDAPWAASGTAPADVAGRPPSPERRGRGLRRWGMAIIALGGTLLLLSIVAGAVFLTIGVKAVGEAKEHSQRVVGVGTVTVDEGQTLYLYQDAAAPTPECTARPAAGTPTGPGRDPRINRTSTSIQFTYQGVTWESFRSLNAPDAGSYRLDCKGATVLVADAPDTGKIPFTLYGLMAILLGGACFGTILLLGLILYFIGRSRQAGKVETRAKAPSRTT